MALFFVDTCHYTCMDSYSILFHREHYVVFSVPSAFKKLPVL